MIEIDGSAGEGGGQVVRTALALSCVTRRPVRIRSIRAGRPNPGLAAQHLAGVLALAGISGARVEGAGIGSSTLEFHPGARLQGGDRVLDVAAVARGGSAGSVTLMLQALLLPLVFADAPSGLTLRGGTHVAWSPPFHHMAQVLLPALAAMGLRAEARLDAWGFYPAGGGKVGARIEPLGGALRPITLVERGRLARVRGVAAAAAMLPAHVPERMAGRARRLLAAEGLEAKIDVERPASPGPGACLALVAEYERAAAGFSSLGERGKTAERVAEEVCRDLIRFHASGAPVEMRLADQLVLPAALAEGRSELRTCRVTRHLLTNVQVVRKFVDATIEVSGAEGAAGSVLVQGAGLIPAR